MKRVLFTIIIGFATFAGLRAQTSTWNTTGNSFPWISADTYFLGSTNNYPLRIRTNNQDRMYISSTTGYVGVGTTIPQQMLHIVDGNILI